MTPRRALLGVAAASLALGGAGCPVRDQPLEEAAGSGTGAAPAPAQAQPRNLYTSAPSSFDRLIDGVRHGVVGIRSARPVKSGPAAMFPGKPESISDVALGTGFLIESKGTFVLTTHQIATAADELLVVLPGGEAVPAKLRGPDPRLGLALLSIEAPRGVEPLRLGNSDELKVGEWVVVLGNPFGDEVTASAGIVSSTGREAAGSFAAGGASSFRTFLQTDARIHRGNAGGPVLDGAGMVVGVAVATTDRPGELSFAIPINRLREVIDALRENRAVKRSWLGAFVVPVTAERAQQLGLPEAAGAMVTEVKLGSPAARSQLRNGDVILKWDERAIDHRSLPWIIAQTPPGKEITLAVWRTRAEINVKVVTEEMPE